MGVKVSNYQSNLVFTFIVFIVLYSIVMYSTFMCIVLLKYFANFNHMIKYNTADQLTSSNIFTFFRSKY